MPCADGYFILAVGNDGQFARFCAFAGVPELAEDAPGCRENFLAALAEYGMDRRDVVPNVNFFMEVPVTADGSGAIAPGRSQPGDYVDLRAEVDALAAISNGPQIHNTCNNYRSQPITAVTPAPPGESEHKFG